MYKHVRNFALAVGALIAIYGGYALFVGGVLGLVWLLEHWFWLTLGIGSALWFFSAPFKRLGNTGA
jgi:hypothetical protein